MDGLSWHDRRQDAADAFAVPVFAELSSASRFNGENGSETPIDHIGRLGPLRKPNGQDAGDWLETPALEDLNLSQSGNDDQALSEPSLEVLSQDGDTTQLQVAPSEDVWRLVDRLPPLSDEPRYLTWKAFYNQESGEKSNPRFISEAGASVFDACLNKFASASQPPRPAGNPLQPRALLRSLWQLCVGRESVLFPFNESNSSFYQAVPDGRASGCSLECSQDLIDGFIQAGNMTRQLRLFVQVASTTDEVLPAVVSFAHCADVALEAIETHCTEAYDSITTLLQLETMLKPVRRLLSTLTNLVLLAQDCETDTAFMEEMYASVQAAEFDSSNYRDILTKMLARTAGNLLRAIEQRVGLGQAALRSSKTGSDDDLAVDDREPLPSFITEQDRRLILQTQASLTFVKANHPEHMALRILPTSKEPVQLCWEFDWKDLERLEQRAAEYQSGVIQAIRDHNIPYPADLRGRETDPVMEPETYTFESFGRDLALDLDELQRGKPSTGLPPDELAECVKGFLQGNDPSSDPAAALPPPFSLSLSLSMRSLLQTQHHIFSYVAAHSLLHEQDLPIHLKIHRSFSFFASGLYSTRLQHVLFSPETESAERTKNVIRTGGGRRGGGMGLKLGTGERRAWPPASSEVRLALMGVLTDCWREEKSMTDNNHPTLPLSAKPGHRPQQFEETSLGFAEDDALPGNLSFAIRTDLSDDTVEKILNPESIYALDFLRLTYDPPAPLRPFFTPRALEIYDRVFAFWLRMLRATSELSTVFDLCRKIPSNGLAMRIRHEMHYFVMTLAAHFRLAAMGGPWSALQQQIAALTAKCEDPCPPLREAASTQPQSLAPSMARLTASHERALHTIAGGLLLRKKQRHAALALEGVLEAVLALGRVLRAHAVAHEHGIADEGAGRDALREAQRTFSTHTDAFRKACRAIVDEREATSSRGRGTIGDDDDDGTASIEALLALLDLGHRQRWHDDLRPDAWVAAAAG